MKKQGYQVLLQPVSSGPCLGAHGIGNPSSLLYHEPPVYVELLMRESLFWPARPFLPVTYSSTYCCVEGPNPVLQTNADKKWRRCAAPICKKVCSDV